MKIWLDDLRPAPEGWQWELSVNEAIECIVCAERHVESAKGMIEALKEAGLPDSHAVKWKRWIAENTIEMISLDHDLGDQAHDGGDGIKLMDWLLERGTLYPLEFHTANPVGRANMERMYKRYWLNQTL